MSKKRLKPDEKVTLSLTLTVRDMRALRDYAHEKFMDSEMDVFEAEFGSGDGPGELNESFVEWQLKQGRTEHTASMMPIWEELCLSARESLNQGRYIPQSTGPPMTDKDVENFFGTPQEQAEAFEKFRRQKLSALSFAFGLPAFEREWLTKDLIKRVLVGCNVKLEKVSVDTGKESRITRWKFTCLKTGNAIETGTVAGHGASARAEDEDC